MRRIGWLPLLLLPWACAHRPAQPISGKTDVPYLGKPTYLTAARQSWSDFANNSEPIEQKAPWVGVKPDRVRALLASVDTHTKALGEEPTPADQQAMAISVEEVHRLVAPYPSLTAEVEELRALVDQLATSRGTPLSRVRARILEVTDLIRLQLLEGK